MLHQHLMQSHRSVRVEHYHALPTTSTKWNYRYMVTGTNNTATTTYTFTPTAGQCATTTTLTITVNPNVTTNIHMQLHRSVLEQHYSPLPTYITNGITGTWSPALNNTATTTYTFTPAAGQCATTATLTSQLILMSHQHSMRLHRSVQVEH